MGPEKASAGSWFLDNQKTNNQLSSAPYAQLVVWLSKYQLPAKRDSWYGLVMRSNPTPAN